MDAHKSFPVPMSLQARMRALTSDLQRARIELATGKLPAADYVERVKALETRIGTLEAEVHARLLADARMGVVRGWTPKRGGAS